MTTWREAFDHEAFHSRAPLGSTPLACTRITPRGGIPRESPVLLSALVAGGLMAGVTNGHTTARSWLKRVVTPAGSSSEGGVVGPSFGGAPRSPSRPRACTGAEPAGPSPPGGANERGW